MRISFCICLTKSVSSSFESIAFFACFLSVFTRAKRSKILCASPRSSFSFLASASFSFFDGMLTASEQQKSGVEWAMRKI